MKLKRSTVAFLIIGIVIVVANGISALSSQPSFCGICHSKEHASWQASDHWRFNCNLCHRRSDITSFLGQRIDIFRMVLLSPLSLLGERATPSRVPSVVCRSCHTDDKTTTVSNGLRMNHKAIVKRSYECTECHSTVVHGKAVPNPRFATMGKCAECHVGKNPGAKCNTCHIEEVDQLDRTFKGPWKLTHGRDWRNLHGMGNVKSCKICHSDDFCLRCHSVNMPHPEAWMNIHGKEAMRSRDGCMKCHKGSLCQSCHQIAMPHPAGFLEVHPKEAKKRGTQLCYACHQKQGCDRCHSQHIHPGIPQDKLRELRKVIRGES
ncbi:MAG TPA: hypothetical protein VE439_01500 [Anaerolineae bacterium]|nr:hypothetical protein [Anaerolineae bacterium]